MARIGTKQNDAKEAQIVNRIKSPDFGWLNVDRYVGGVETKGFSKKGALYEADRALNGSNQKKKNVETFFL